MAIAPQQGGQAVLIYSCSVMGAAHAKHAMVCQDASMHESRGGRHFVAVADGHGSALYFRSDIGSRFAVQAANECMSGMTAPSDGEIIQLKRDIIARWRALIREHFAVTPFTDEEFQNVPGWCLMNYINGEQVEVAYGSTLIAVLLTEDFMLALQIGDGNCFTLSDDDTLGEPIPKCRKCVGNITSSLCEHDALDSFRHYFTDAPPVAAAIATDGIEKSFAGRTLREFFRRTLFSLCESDLPEMPELLRTVSRTGSGDDISVAVIKM